MLEYIIASTSAGQTLKPLNVDHPLQPVDREEITFSVAVTEVAGPQKAPAIVLDEGG